MKKSLSRTVAVTIACLLPLASTAQAAPDNDPNPVQLELTAEVAATTQDGYPAALRITIKNVGNVAVDMPLLSSSCAPDGGVRVEYIWTATNDGSRDVHGYGCGFSDRPSLMERVQDEWLRLQPGEFLTETESLRPQFGQLKSGTVKYWVEYTPPVVSKAERIELVARGYFVPALSLRTEAWSFTIN